MATRTNFEGSNEIGVFSALTNSYCLSGTTKINTGVVLVVVVMKRLWFVRWRLRHNDILRIAAHRADLLFGWCLFCFKVHVVVSHQEEDVGSTIVLSPNTFGPNLSYIPPPSFFCTKH